MRGYRWRTWIRGRVPWKLVWLFPKGAKSCGDHQWYVAYKNLIGQRVQRCYHCEPAKRVHPEDKFGRSLAPDTEQRGE